MPRALPTEHRNSANLTREQCAKMLGITTRDLGRLVHMGIPTIPSASGKGILLNAGRAREWCACPHMRGTLAAMRNTAIHKRIARLLNARVRDRERRAEKKINPEK